MKINNFLVKAKSLVQFIGNINIRDSSKSITKSEVLIFMHDNDYGLKLEERAYSPLMDSLRENIEERGYKCQTINLPFSKTQGIDAWSNPFLINKIYLIALIKDILIRRIVRAGANYRKELYEYIIRKSETTCIIAIGADHHLCSASKSSEVPCIELLHGIGYDPIPYNWDKLKKEFLPDCILSLDKKSTTTLTPLQQEGIKIIQIPHPFLKKFRRKNQEKSPNTWKDKAIILISLQWGYDNQPFAGIIKNNIILDELTNAIILSKKKNIIWAFRLHPVQLRSKKYKHHVDFIQNFCEQHSNTQWQWSTEMPLPAVLQQCAGHITMSSMSSYEAAYMGIKTLALCPTLRTGSYYQNMFSDLEEAGYLTKAQADTQSIIDWVEAVQPTQPFLDNLADEEAWEEAVEWMLGSRYKNDENKA